MDADQVEIRAPQVLEKGDTSLGMRLGEGDIFNGEPLVGLNLEHMVSTNVGISGYFGYDNYASDYQVGVLHGEWDYSVFALAAMVNFHADLFKVKNLDTYASLGLGHNFVNSRWTSNAGITPLNNADSSSSFLVAYLNCRYFLNSNWGFDASLGTGLGTFALGADYLF